MCTTKCESGDGGARLATLLRVYGSHHQQHIGSHVRMRYAEAMTWLRNKASTWCAPCCYILYTAARGLCSMFMLSVEQYPLSETIILICIPIKVLLTLSVFLVYEQVDE